MRAPPGRIPIPPFPVFLKWINVPRVRVEHESGHPILVEFWDFCRPNSMRTLPYVKAWHERYGADGLRVIGVHCPGFAPSTDADEVRAAVERLGISHPVLLDPELEVWAEYGNEGWPARYLWDGEGMLFDMHYGEGAYLDTELAIQELLGVSREPLPALRPEDLPGAALAAQSEDRAGAYNGPYEAGGVWAVLSGHGSVQVNGEELQVHHAGAYELISHPRHTRAELSLGVGPGVVCHATCFTPGLVA